MSEEKVFDCIYNLWTGFVGKTTCDAGFLKCNEMSCPAYTPRPKKRPMTNYDEITNASPEELSKIIVGWIADVATLCGYDRKSFDIEGAEKYTIDWLKSSIEED